MDARFVVDVHLGKLARLLRLLGLDTVYNNNFTLDDLINISIDQGRILLTRNRSIPKQVSIKIFILSSQKPLEQLKQLVEYFTLQHQYLPFSRCIVCNGVLKPVSKESIIALLEQRTSRYYNDFCQCHCCKRIYWKGSHYEMMQKTIKNITAH